MKGAGTIVHFADVRPPPGQCWHMVQVEPRMNADWKQCRQPAKAYLSTSGSKYEPILQWVCDSCAKKAGIFGQDLSPEEIAVAEVMLS